MMAQQNSLRDCQKILDASLFLWFSGLEFNYFIPNSNVLNITCFLLFSLRFFGFCLGWTDAPWFTRQADRDPRFQAKPVYLCDSPHLP